MSLYGTQQKCKACGKTVYLVDQLTADEVVYHNSCFRCSHCKGTLKLSNYASLEGVLYCKPHLEQKFKQTGSFDKSFETPAGFKSPIKLQESASFTARPARAPVAKFTRLFSGTQEKCVTCSKTVYPLEKVSVEGLAYHKACFKCTHGGCVISPSNYAALEGVLYCKHHFTQLFKEKGNYSQLSKSSSMNVVPKEVDA